ncbi:MAG: LamG domain-containing protein [Clostridia bacterium]|nr:LamG domain-containing protein [Clostridia bacterium]
MKKAVCLFAAITMLLWFFAPFTQASPETALLLHYDFTSIQNGKVCDQSGNGFDATVVDNSSDQTGVLVENGTMSLSNGSYLELPQDLIENAQKGLRNCDEMTIAFFSQASNSPNWPIYISNYYVAANSWHMRHYVGIIQYSNGSIRVEKQTGANSGTTFGGVYDATRVHHVAAVISGTQTKLYVDGIYKGESDDSVTIKEAFDYGPISGREGLAAIGYSKWNEGYAGTISDFRIYNAALSQEEIAALCSNVTVSINYTYQGETVYERVESISAAAGETITFSARSVSTDGVYMYTPTSSCTFTADISLAQNGEYSVEVECSREDFNGVEIACVDQNGAAIRQSSFLFTCSIGDGLVLTPYAPNSIAVGDSVYARDADNEATVLISTLPQKIIVTYTKRSSIAIIASGAGYSGGYDGEEAIVSAKNVSETASALNAPYVYKDTATSQLSALIARAAAVGFEIPDSVSRENVSAAKLRLKITSASHSGMQWARMAAYETENMAQTYALGTMDEADFAAKNGDYSYEAAFWSEEEMASESVSWITIDVREAFLAAEDKLVLRLMMPSGEASFSLAAQDAPYLEVDYAAPTSVSVLFKDRDSGVEIAPQEVKGAFVGQEYKVSLSQMPAEIVFDTETYYLCEIYEKSVLCADGSNEIVIYYGNAERKAKTDYLKNNISAAKTGVVEVTDAESGFIHPGITLTKTELDRMRAHVHAGDEPWYTAYRSFASDSRCSTTPRIHYGDGGTSRYVNVAYKDDHVGVLARIDSGTAVKQAIMWYITGNDTYRSNVLYILRNWSKMETISSLSDEQIYFGTAMYKFALAAEILRYSDYDGTRFGQCAENVWTAADTAAIDSFLNLTYDKYNRWWHFMNQHGINNMAFMASAIWRNDVSDYAKAVERTTVNSIYDNYRSGSIKNVIRLMEKNDLTGEVLTEPIIQHVEMGRDQGHAYGDIGALATLAMTAVNQNTKVDKVTGAVSDAADAVDVFEFLDHRLLCGANLISKYNLGGSVDYVPAWCNQTSSYTMYTSINDTNRGLLYPSIGIIYNYYKYYAKSDMSGEEIKYMAQAYETAIPEGNSLEFLGFGTLLFTGDEAMGGSYYQAVDERSVNTSSRFHLENSLGVVDCGAAKVLEEDDIRYIEADENTVFAWNIGFLPSSDNVSIRVRTYSDTTVELINRHISRGSVFAVYHLPNTQGQWRTFSVVRSAISGGERINFARIGEGSVDIDYIEFASDTLPSIENLTYVPQVFENGSEKYICSAQTQLTFTASGSVEIGGKMPATLGESAATISLSDEDDGKSSYLLLTVSDGETSRTYREDAVFCASFETLCSKLIKNYDPAKRYSSDTLAAFNAAYRAASEESAMSMTSDAFYAALHSLIAADEGLFLLDKFVVLDDGTEVVDLVSTAVFSTSNGMSAAAALEEYKKLIDNNTSTQATLKHANGTSGGWLMADFGDNRGAMFTQIILNDASAYIEVSNDALTWVAPDNGIYRYVRFYGTSLSEVRLVGEYSENTAQSAGRIFSHSTASGIFMTQDLAEAYRGDVTIEFDVSAAALTDGVMAFSSSAASPAAWTDYSILLRFNTGGYFDAYNASKYEYANRVAYSAKSTHHIKLSIDIYNQRYSAWADDMLIAQNYAFRTSAGDVSNIAKFAFLGGASADSMDFYAESMEVTQYTEYDEIYSGGDFTTVMLDQAYSGIVTIEYDITAFADNIDAVVGLVGSGVTPTAWSDLAIATRLTTEGLFDAYNGDSAAYGRDSDIPYTKNVAYHVKIVADTQSSRFSIYVDDVCLAADYALRTAAVSEIDKICVRGGQGSAQRQFSISNLKCVASGSITMYADDAFETITVSSQSSEQCILIVSSFEGNSLVRTESAEFICDGLTDIDISQMYDHDADVYVMLWESFATMKPCCEGLVRLE